MRSGILPLEIETGRWKGTELFNRVCQLCSAGCVEDEAHFLFTCDFHKDERQSFAHEFPLNLSTLSTSEKFIILIQENMLAFAKYLWKIYKKRKGKLLG